MMSEVIGSIANLVCIPWKDNVTKKGTCSILKEDLI
jgi:hypothetical protein